MLEAGETCSAGPSGRRAIHALIEREVADGSVPEPTIIVPSAERAVASERVSPPRSTLFAANRARTDCQPVVAVQRLRPLRITDPSAFTATVFPLTGPRSTMPPAAVQRNTRRA